MRHLKKGRKFGRETGQRRALMKSLASSFFLLGSIMTTEARAKELRPYVERIITRAKKPTAANRRIFLQTFPKIVVAKIFKSAELLSSRPGGYTRLAKFGARKSDSAKLAIIELVK